MPSQLSNNAVLYLNHFYSQILNQNVDAEIQRRRLRLILLCQRFAYVLRTYKRLSFEIQIGHQLATTFGYSEDMHWAQYVIAGFANFETSNAVRYTRIVVSLLKLVFGNKAEQWKTQQIHFQIKLFRSDPHYQRTEQLLQLLMAIKETEIPVDLSIYDPKRTSGIGIPWMIIEVLGKRINRFCGDIKFAPMLHKLPSPLTDAALTGLIDGPDHERNTTKPLFSILTVPAARILLSGSMGSFVGDGAYEENPALEHLHITLTEEDLMTKRNFHDEFKVLRTLGSKFSLGICAYEHREHDGRPTHIINDFDLRAKLTLLMDMDRTLARLRSVVDSACNCGLTLKSLCVQYGHIIVGFITNYELFRKRERAQSSIHSINVNAATHVPGMMRTISSKLDALRLTEAQSC